MLACDAIPEGHQLIGERILDLSDAQSPVEDAGDEDIPVDRRGDGDRSIELRPLLVGDRPVRAGRGLLERMDEEDHARRCGPRRIDDAGRERPVREVRRREERHPPVPADASGRYALRDVAPGARRDGTRILGWYAALDDLLHRDRVERVTRSARPCEPDASGLVAALRFDRPDGDLAARIEAAPLRDDMERHAEARARTDPLDATTR